MDPFWLIWCVYLCVSAHNLVTGHVLGFKVFFGLILVLICLSSAVSFLVAAHVGRKVGMIVPIGYALLWHYNKERVGHWLRRTLS